MLKQCRTRFPNRTLLIVAGVLALAGCSGHDKAPAQAAASTKSTLSGSNYVAVARGRVDVQGGLLHLYSAATGTVDAVKVQAGDHVDKGQVLATLDSAAAQAQLAIAKAQVMQAQAHAAVLADRAKAAHKNAATLQSAADAGAGSGQDALNAQQKAAQLQAMHTEASAQLAVARGQLRVAQHQLSLQTLRAPVAATVTAVNVQPGSHVAAQGSPALQLLPDRPHVIRAELNQEYVSAVHKGMQAKVVLDSDHETVLGTAHVLRVGEIFSRSRLQDNPALSAGTRTVQCVLAFNKPAHLRIGQLVLVRIMGSGTSHGSAKVPKGS